MHQTLPDGAKSLHFSAFNYLSSDIMMVCYVKVDAALGRVDEVIEDLIVELKMRGIYDCINIIVVSDHGR